MATEQSTAVEQGYWNLTSGERSVVERLAALEPYLWGALLVVLLADIVSTYAGIQAGLTEGNPAMRLAIDTAGIVALVGVKLAVLGFGAGVRRFLDERGAVVPLGLALPWAVAASVNVALLV